MKNLKSKRYLILLAALLIVAIGIVFSFYTYFSRETFIKNVEEDLTQGVQRIAAEINVSLKHAKGSADLLSFTISQGGFINTRPEDLPIFKNSPFENVNYYSVENIPQEGPLGDALQNALLKKTGIWLEEVNSEYSILNVHAYAPLLKEDSVVGVLDGSLGNKASFKSILKYSLYGKSLMGFLCDEHLKIIDTNAEVLLDSRLNEINPKTIQKFRQNALKNNAVSFRFTTDIGTTIASIALVQETGWYVVQVVPYEVLESFTKKLIVRALVAVFLIALFIMAHFGILYRRIKKKYSEVEQRHLNVIKALMESFEGVFEVNIETGSLESHRVDSRIFDVKNYDDNIHYNQMISNYIHQIVFAEDRKNFDRVVSIELLQREFYKSDRVEFTYRTNILNEIHYAHAMFIKPSKNRPEVVVGVKIIDDTMRIELEKRKALNEQRIALVKALDKARKADKAKSNFLLNMSHDIRTPMNSIMGYEALAKKMLWNLKLPKESTDMFEKYLDNIEAASTQLLNLLNSVLDMARIESGLEILDEAPILTAEMTESLVVTFEQAALQKKMLLQVSRNFKNKCIMGDKVCLQRILLNLVNNSIKYTKEHGIVRISLRDLPHENPKMCYVEMVVEDTGVGISESFLPRIFNDFEREQSALTQGIGGAGLGLSIVKKLVDLMHGNISIASRVGEGTRVTVVTPHAIVQEFPKEISTLPTDKWNNLSGKRVLLADDDASTCEIISDALKNQKMDVYVASDGNICLQKLDKYPAGTFDIILMDLKMPRLDGYDATAKIRKLEDSQKASIPIIAITANAFDEERQKALDIGMNGHLSKPIDFKMLYQIMNSILGK